VVIAFTRGPPGNVSNSGLATPPFDAAHNAVIKVAPMLDEDRLDINEGICSHFFRLRAFDRRQLGVRAIDVTSLVHRRLYTQV